MKKILILLSLLFPIKSFSADYERFTYIECDKVAKRLHIEERIISGSNNIFRLEQKHPNYFLQYGEKKRGECDIGSREITWTAWGDKVYIRVDGKPWVGAIRVSTFRELAMSYGDENELRLDMVMNPNGIKEYLGMPVIPSKKYYNSDYVMHIEYEK